ncbi:TOBE domain-containing protein [Brasilonema sp. CT11]|nr:TOBE domain-containing protein [Brasilonema sp. CT11]
MPRKNQGWITFQVSDQERKILDELSKKLQCTKTAILRELIRGLEFNSWRYAKRQASGLSPFGRLPAGASPQSIPTKKQSEKNADTHYIDITSSKKPLKISSHNILQGVVTQVIRTEVSTQVTLKVVQEVDLTSIIATTSADELELHEGTEAYALINPCVISLGIK